MLSLSLSLSKEGSLLIIVISRLETEGSLLIGQAAEIAITIIITIYYVYVYLSLSLYIYIYTCI